MDSVADRYRRVAAGFTAKVTAVPDDAWPNPAPCDGWTTRDLVRHAVDSSGIFLGFIGRQVPAEPSVDDDPVRAWTNARDAVQAALDDPAAARAEYDGFRGRSTFEAAINQFICPDVTVHTWDLARAAGLDERLDGEAVRAAYAGFREFPENMLRSPGVCGPAVEAPAGADEQTEMLAFLGRRV
jgi:uncharacterized protein (TIGR03086 family)